MHPMLAEWLARQEQTNFADLRGGEVRLRLPVREGVANEVLKRTVVASQSNLQDLTLAIGAANTLDVRVKPSMPFVPALTLTFVAEPQLRFTPSPTMALELKRQGLPAMIAGMLPMMQKRLPPEVTLTAERLTIDIGRVLEGRGLGRFVPFIKSGTFDSEPGVLWVTVGLAVD
jgi:hypothetical protein